VPVLEAAAAVILTKHPLRHPDAEDNERAGRREREEPTD
jgi:hypothetical protein